MNGLFYRKYARRFLSLALAALLLILSACRADETQETTTTAPEQVTEAPLPQGTITVPYTGLDSLNPFFAKSLLNTSLISLVYDPLLYLDGGYSPVPCIAQDCRPGELTVSVTLKDGLVFSDSTALGAADVAYSFALAKEAPLYKASLENVEACTADSGFAVTFTLRSPDVNAVNLLTFPIVKNGTAESADDIPVGSGCFKYEFDELRPYLSYNLRHAGGIPEIGTVRLRPVNESATLMHLLNTGAIDCFYTDMSEGVAKRSYSGANEVYLNNLVFIGVNHKSPMLGFADVRKAISLAVSRISLAENAFVSHARAAVFPVNAAWDMLTGVKDPANAKFEADPDAADALLHTLGSGAGEGGEPLYYTLICEDGNAFMKAAAEQIAASLSLVNLNIEVLFLPHEEFTDALETGNFNLYLSEIKLTKNMDLSAFFTEGGAAAAGIDLESLDTDDVYFAYRSEQADLTAFLTSFDNSMPFIPLLFRNGQFCYSRSVKNGVEATEDRLYLNVADWKL